MEADVTDFRSSTECQKVTAVLGQLLVLCGQACMYREKQPLQEKPTIFGHQHTGTSRQGDHEVLAMVYHHPTSFRGRLAVIAESLRIPLGNQPGNALIVVL